MALNPSLKKEYIPKLNQGYDLVLPQRVIPGFQYFLDTQQPAELRFSYRTTEMMIDHRQSVFELAGVLKVDPYLLRAWNEIQSDFVEVGDRIIIHELYDPSQVYAEEVNLVPFAKKQASLNPLPPSLDYKRMLYQFFLRERERQEEVLSWQFHQM